MSDLKTLIKKYKGDMLSSYRLSCSVVSGKVVSRTPVEDGSLQLSWTPNNGGPIAENVYMPDDMQRHNIAAVINTLDIGDTYSLANGQPYACVIEYEGWSQEKAPSGMLRISVAEWDDIVAGSVS